MTDGSGEPKNLTATSTASRSSRTGRGRRWIAIDEEAVAFVQSNGEGSIRRVEGPGHLPRVGVGRLEAVCVLDPTAASACSRSATRSFADSRPTERRTRLSGTANGASAVEACVIATNADQALDTAGLSASIHTLVRDQRGGVLGVAGEEEIIPPKPRICRGDHGPGGRAAR